MSDSLLKPVSLKYRSRQNVYGNYKMKWIYPTQYQTSYSLTSAGQIQNTYQIQSNVFFVTQRTVRIDGSNVSFTNMA